MFKNLKSDGVGADAKHTEAISAEEEKQLWESGVLNVSTPTGLLRAVFYMCGKCFCLRGGLEHRHLSVSQLKRLTDPDRYLYLEHSSKNRPGGVDRVKLDHKSVRIVANSSVGERCPVFILDKYISKLPNPAIEKELFYCRPLPSIPKVVNDPWYVAVPIGKNVLAKMVSTICDEAGISGKKTNHSLRVSGTTSLFNAGVPERVIQQRTGHRSIEGLRIYERITDEQEMAVSNILTGESMRYDDCRGKKDCLDEIIGTVVNGTNKGNVSSSSSDVKEVDQSCLGTLYNNCNVNFYSTQLQHHITHPIHQVTIGFVYLHFFPCCPPVYDYCDVFSR